MKKYLSILFSFFFISCGTTSKIAKIEAEPRDPANFQSCFETMRTMFTHKMFTMADAVPLSSVKTFDDLESTYGEGSLKKVHREISQADLELNNKIVENLLTSPYPVKAIRHKSHIFNEKKVNAIYKAVAESKVHKNADYYDDDPTDPIGFCFGRGTIAHMEALTKNAHPDIMKKIWVAGQMGIWDFHVAFMIFTHKGWMVIDTDLPGPVLALDWIEYWRADKMKSAISKDSKDLMVFVTQASRWGEADNRTYSAIDFFNTEGNDFDDLLRQSDHYRGYFHDYFEELDTRIKKK